MLVLDLGYDNFAFLGPTCPSCGVVTGPEAHGTGLCPGCVISCEQWYQENSQPLERGVTLAALVFWLKHKVPAL